MTKSFRVFSFILLMSLSSNLYAWDLAPLASLKGAAIVTGVYGATNGISNWIGGYRWNKHAGFSDETTAVIQEVGWLTAAVESWVLCLIIPLMVYQFNKKFPTPSQESFGEFDDSL